MNENSAMILNLGLHYMESTSLANYWIIWKTTTSMNKEKDIESRLKSDWQRFQNPKVGKYLV